MRLLPFLLLVTACARKEPKPLAERAANLDWHLTPVLPAPDSGTYTTSPGYSRDPVVARLVEGKAFDRALEASAAALALAAVEGQGGLQRWELREAAWRGGWPYPVVAARGWSANNGEAPPDDLFAWVDGLPADEPMALVRARGRLGDGWVGMLAHPEADLGALPRAAPLGTILHLPALPGASFRLADGGGRLTEGKLDAATDLLLTSAGEWVLLVARDGKEVARFPIYVDLPTPTDPLLRSPAEAPPINEAADADRWARTLLAHVRKMYRLAPWDTDPVLDAAARALATDPDRPQAEILKALGFAGQRTAVWTCDDVTVENCLDRLVWEPRRRGDLLSTALDALGMYPELDARGVHLRIVLADTRG